MPIFRHTAGFGKRIEYWVIGLLLKEGFDVFVPLVDDDGVDALIRGPNGKIIELQIKARSLDTIFGDAALFSALHHPDVRQNYYFLFYSERMDTMWFMSSADFVLQAVTNKSGKNKGKRSIWFNGKNSKLGTEHPRPQFLPWCVSENGKHNFSVIRRLFDENTETP